MEKGTAISVVCKDKILSLETNEFVNQNSLFLVASISKIITAMGTLKLIESGKLDIHQDINKYLDFEIRNPHMNIIITVEHLLQHRSSLKDSELFTPNTTGIIPNLREYLINTLNNKNMWMTSEYVKDDLIVPYWYSNIGFVILGYIIEIVSGSSFIDYINQEIFFPLNIFNASWITCSGECVCYENGEAVTNPNVIEYPACQLRISISDLTKILFEFTSDNKSVLNEKLISLMCPDNFNKGLAWWGNDSWFGEFFQNCWIHRGDLPGVATQINYYPATKSGFIVLTNSNESICDLVGKCKKILSENR